MKTAVIYARYSSSNQREESIAGQIRECRQYAERNCMHVIHEYTDSALTGTSDKRPAFQQMIHDSDRHTFDAVIVWKLDRFARNRYDAAMYRHLLAKNNVKIFSAMENISDSPEGIILEGLMESLAEYYSANLAENVRRGLYDSALERKVLSRPTFGYKKSAAGTYEIDTETAPIVQRVFREYADGKPYMAILEGLNNDGIRTINGNKFTNNSLRKMLKNDRYIGIYRYKDIIDLQGIPPIIDKALFDQVQKEIQRRSFTKIRQAPQGSEVYLLSGKLFCGHCGEPMTGERGRSKTGKEYRYYSCNGTKTRSRNGCKKKRVQKEVIEAEVMRLINEEILTDDFIALMVNAVIKYQTEDHEASVLSSLRQQHKTVTRKLNNLVTAAENGIWSETTNNRLHELEAEQRHLEDRIREETLTQPVFTAEDITAFLTGLKRAQKTDTDAQRYLINSCISRIYLFDSDDGQRLVIDVNYAEHGKQPARLESVVRAISPLLCHQRFARTQTADGDMLLIASLPQKKSR